MSVDVSTEVVIGRPRETVAAYAGDPTHAPEWYVNIESVKWKTAPPVTKGSRLAFVAKFLGKTISYTYEVVDHQPGERMVMRTAEGPFPMETTYCWESLGAGRTRMTLRNRGEPRGFTSVLAPLMGVAMRRTNQKDLERLKELLESSVPAAGSEASRDYMTARVPLES